ncbi:MAG: Gfo/Idh/MocA family oxidoreductase [Kiritimatiellae bacterium]|nr:Gfo/Idh/MocA family oxidoreductase [Kiritimatiellia bacterium]
MNRKHVPHTVVSTRRQFLSASALAAASMGFPAVVRAQNLNSKLNIVVIGCGGRGGGNMAAVAAKGEHIAALCDVNENNLNAAAAKHADAKRFIDFRQLYAELKDYDAVVVSTAEHTHALATLPALTAGKHVYCEKPLAHNVWETRIIREAAKKANVATQMGTQIHAGTNYRRVVELIQGGAIGPVTEVHVWVSRAWGLQSPEAAARNKDILAVQDRPKEAQTPPPYLHWDLFLGPAADRPFHSDYFPGPKWYRWWDFGSGTMSDLGSHWNDLPFWALKLDAPLTVEAFGPPPHPELAPASMSARYEYGPRGGMPAVKLTWYQGEMKPQVWTDKKIPQWGSGCLFIGSKGMLLSDYSKHILLPEDTFKNFARPAPTIPDSLGHHAEWLHACKNGEPTTCNFDYSGGLTEANHLGNVAYRVGKKIIWDAAQLRVTNVPEAAAFVKRTYRKGWEIKA